ncbi:hypothetical protein AX16_003124 [Volvariella volvacea WC 439]|nr:hypothetical protein AX16_003124 [Volvariella volvacea WC 439]
MLRNATILTTRPALARPVAPLTASLTRTFASKLRSRPVDEEPLDDLKLPRYLRRAQAKAADTKASPRTEQPPTATPQKEFRSRHYDPSKEKQKNENMRLLEPHVLSARLKKLCDKGKVEEAVTMLKNSPLDAQNTPVWNTLIWECMKANRFKVAYSLYVDMKRRGHSPTTRTFQTMFTGLSRIENWSTHTKQLANARSLYEAYCRHIQSLKKHEPESPDIVVHPLAAYIKILGDSGNHQEIFDVYYSLDASGPFSANQFVYTAMFQALASVQGPPPRGTDMTPTAKIAADARLLWTQMIKASKKSTDVQIDGHVVASAVAAMARGRSVDQDFAFSLVRDYFGLTSPGESPAVGTIPLSPQSFANVLFLCNASRRYGNAVYFFAQLKRRPPAMGDSSILDRPHMEEILKAMLELNNPDAGERSVETLEWMLRQEITGHNGPKIRPSLSTYNLVLTACWRSADWQSALRIFDLMTGYHSHDFMDGAVSAAPRFDNRGPGRNIMPTAEGASAMLRTALATENAANIRQCLRIIDHLGLDTILGVKGSVANPNESSKAVKNKMFFAVKLASALVQAVEQVLKSAARDVKNEEEVQKWRALARSAQGLLNHSGSSAALSSDFIPTALPRRKVNN